MAKVADKRAQMLAARVRLVVFDVDGVLTDGTVEVDESGRESRRYSMCDGHGFELLRDAGIRAIWMTRSAHSPSIVFRAYKLGVELHAGVKDKAAKLAELYEYPEEVCYVGDDVFDLEAMRYAGFSACPADSEDAVKEEADYVCQNTGGRGAAREVIELILSCHA